MNTVHRVDAVIDGSGVIGNRVMAGASGVEVTEARGPGVETIDRGGFVVPGLRDAHLHLGSIGAATTGISLEEAQGFADIAALLAAHGSGDVVAIGFDETRLAESSLLTRSDLDTMISDRAVLVYRVCGHIAIANSMALERAGITAGTPDPPGGTIDRAPDGTPNGILRETAIDAVSSVTIDTQRALSADDLLATAQRLTTFGLTRVDAMVPAGAPAWCGPDDELDLLLAIGSELPLDVSALLISDSVADLRFHRERIGNGSRVVFGGWKGFADGSLGGHTAALRRPYSDMPDTSGTKRGDAGHFRLMAETAIELGGSACIHAIGDAAVSHVLDVFEPMISDGAPPDRLRVEHASVLSSHLVGRLSESGVVASVQPSFIASDAHWMERRLGPDRARWAYPLRSMLDAGTTLLGGSDAPVERPDPLAGMRAAVQRNGFHPEESLDPIDAVGMYADGSFGSRAMWIAPDLSSFEWL